MLFINYVGVFGRSICYDANVKLSITNFPTDIPVGTTRTFPVSTSLSGSPLSCIDNIELLMSDGNALPSFMTYNAAT